MSATDDTIINPLKRKMATGAITTWAMITMPSVAATQIWARSGIDALLIDLEHAPISIESAHAMIAATAGTDSTPIVRVPWNLAWLVKPLVDAGAMGICFPMIGDAAGAEAAVRSVKYPPAGDRGWGPFYAAPRWGLTPQEYTARANDEVLAHILIERPEAIDNIDEIVRVPGIDLLTIAPFDLSVLMGHPGQIDHPEVQRAIQRVEDAVLASDIPLQGVALSPEQGNRLIEKGYRSVMLGFDWMILQRAIAGLTVGMNLERSSHR